MADANHLNQADYQALAEFRYQIRCFVRFSEQAARKAGIEPQHHQLMLALKGARDGAEPCIGYLADRLQIRHHSAVELVDRLVKRGLIQRSRSEKDRREVHVRLTQRGERILRELTLHTREELRSASPTLVDTLKKMMVTLRGNRKAPGTNRTTPARRT